ncbi:hypothetical protein, partial [Nocardia farcinica]|uniref:hypothetical protein n=1 Tax=Nocardia farcinica TaxID=37329 RepID=UPI0034DB3551
MTLSATTAAHAAAARLGVSCAEIIGASTRSVIVHGSLATGDFRPDTPRWISGGVATTGVAPVSRPVRPSGEPVLT